MATLDEPATSYENRFSVWLAKQATPAQLSAVYAGCMDINSFYLGRGVLRRPLFENDNTDALTALCKKLCSSVKYGKRKATMIVALQYYCRFLAEIRNQSATSKPTTVSQVAAKPTAEPTPAPQATKSAPAPQVAAKAAPAPQTAKPSLAPTSQAVAIPAPIMQTAPKTPTPSPAIQRTATAAVSEVDRLLADPDFSMLKLALAKENIRTIDQLKALSLYAFMNRQNLYSFAMRQTVLEKVRALLDPPTAADPARLYTLRVGDAVYTGNTPAKVFLHFCEDLAKKHPLPFRTLLDYPLGSATNVQICRAQGKYPCLRMENPTGYIQEDLSPKGVLTAVEAILQCFSKAAQISLQAPTATREQPPPAAPSATAASSWQIAHAKNLHTAVAEEEATYGEKSEQTHPTDARNAKPSPAKTLDKDSELIDLAEEIVLAADLDGISCNDLSLQMKNRNRDITQNITKELIPHCKHIVAIKDNLYHEKAFVEWEEGAETLCDILDKLMQKNQGYVSASQLYERTRLEMRLFLKDNDMDDERAVYDIAQHLFEKNHAGGKCFVFSRKMHISAEAAPINNQLDLIYKFAAEQGGVFQEEALESYLKTVGLDIVRATRRSLMKLGEEPQFFVYEPGTLIFSQSMAIDDMWKDRVKTAIGHLLQDADDYVILRAIGDNWYQLLPALPGGLTWTPLLLQQVLHFYGAELGARTIPAMASQSLDTLHAMLVRFDINIQNFGDAVLAYLHDQGIKERTFGAEALRKRLLAAGMIRGSELLHNMPKALARHECFAWDAGGKNVTVRM